MERLRSLESFKLKRFKHDLHALNTSKVILVYLVVSWVEKVNAIFLSLVVEVSMKPSSDKVHQLLPSSLSVINFKEDHLKELLTKSIILTGEPSCPGA